MKEIYTKLGSIEATLVSVKEDVSEIKTKVSRHENFLNKTIGYCLAVSAGIGLAVSFIPKVVKGMID